VLPLPPDATPVRVHDLLCIQMDGDDGEAMPARICLTGVTSHPDSPAARRAQQLLGATLWRAAMSLVGGTGPATATVVLPEDVREARLVGWRRLSGVAIGVDVQPGELDVVVLGAHGDDVIGRRSTALLDMRAEAVVERIRQVVNELRVECDAEIAGAPLAVGVQVPGRVDPATGMVVHLRKRMSSGESESDWDWAENTSLATMVATATELPTRVLNDVVGYATYERWFHQALNERCRAVLLISQGIGAKLVVGGEVVDWMPMEIGNMVIDPGGRWCDCGGRGCVEATAGTLAIIEQIQEITGSMVLDIDDAISRVDQGGSSADPAVLAVFRTAGHHLAQGIAYVQAIANPTSWALYGPRALLSKEGTAAGDAFLEALFAFPEFVSFKAYRDSDVHRRPIVGSEGAHGAALAALERLGLGRPELATGGERGVV
jgi:predicted NBD/HSP70 family sugar kinase